MNAQRDPERLIRAFLMEGQTELADQVYDAVRAEVEQKRQRAVIGPWRMPTMNKFVPIGLGVAAVALAVFVGGQLLASPAPGGGGGVPSAQPSATPSPSPTPRSSPSPATPPPLTQTFTSKMHGFSVSYPKGWTARAATEPWTDGTFPFLFEIPQADFLHEGSFNLNLVFGSQPIGDSTPEDWVAEQMAGPEGCATTEPITVDGANGLIGAGDCKVAVVTTNGRGYVILAGISPDEPSNATTYDRVWFEQVLATVQLQPEDAVDVAPSATP